MPEPTLNQNVKQLLLVGDAFCFVDLEGTLANHDHRLPLLNAQEYDAYEEAAINDEVNEDIYGLLWVLNTEIKIVVMSTRTEKYRSATETWLTRHNIPASAVLLRPGNDWAPQPTLKARMINEFFDGEDKAISFVIDDNLAVCEKLKEEGYHVWHRL